MFSKLFVVFSSLSLAAIPFTLSGCTNGGDTADTTQGWTQKQRGSWYEATQGSRLIPKSWFDALEVSDGDTAFSEISNLTSYGLLPPRSDSVHKLPIGMAVDRQADEALKVSGLRWYKGQLGGEETAEPWIGLNCATCHTGSHRYQGKTSVVDGAPGLFDYQNFTEALKRALTATKQKPEKWKTIYRQSAEGKERAGQSKIAGNGVQHAVGLAE